MTRMRMPAIRAMIGCRETMVIIKWLREKDAIA
jgi:hypothetical protein